MSGGRDAPTNHAALIGEVHQAYHWARRVCPWMDEVELFLNPADCDSLGAPLHLHGLPVRCTIGVPVGQAMIFDRRRTRYIRTGEQL